MTLTADTYLPLDANQPRGRRPWCADCDTDQYLLVDSVTTLNRQQNTLAAAVSCTNCYGYRVVATTAALISGIPLRTQGDADVVREHAAYFHCQEPMSAVTPELIGGHWPASTHAGPTEFLGVYLQTRVLRCRCGFQMEIPN